MKQNFEKVLSKKAVDELAGDLNDWFNRYCYELFDCKTHEWLDITKFAKYWTAKELAAQLIKDNPESYGYTVEKTSHILFGESIIGWCHNAYTFLRILLIKEFFR